MLGWLPIIIAVLAFATYLALGAVRKRRKPRELRGDWWTPFEREFRAYAQRASKSSGRDHPGR